MMAQDRVESTREAIYHGRFVNQFPPDIIKLMRLFERIITKYVDKGCQYSLIELILTKKRTHTHTHTHSHTQTHTHIYIDIYIYIERERERKR